MSSNADNMSVDSEFDGLGYGYANAPNVRQHPTVYGERDLWCAVIAQAFIDIGAIAPVTSGRKAESLPARGKECDEAVRWLLRDKKDFVFICDLAGVSPHIIRRAAQVYYGLAASQSLRP
jgi:hypothetical protein